MEKHTLAENISSEILKFRYVLGKTKAAVILLQFALKENELIQRVHQESANNSTYRVYIKTVRGWGPISFLTPLYRMYTRLSGAGDQSAC